jgi:hypothetical protein
MRQGPEIDLQHDTQQRLYNIIPVSLSLGA